MRLTRDDAVTVASDWVRARYPIVPEIAWVQEFSGRTIDQFEQRTGKRFSQDERRQLSNKWWVSFRCSWDTDELGMPSTLHLLIDDITGAAESALSAEPRAFRCKC